MVWVQVKPNTGTNLQLSCVLTTQRMDCADAFQQLLQPDAPSCAERIPWGRICCDLEQILVCLALGAAHRCWIDLCKIHNNNVVLSPGFCLHQGIPGATRVL